MKKERIPWSAPICIAIIILLFWLLGQKMGLANLLNTIMRTSHDLLLNTVFYLMAICVITGAIGRLFVEFGVVKMLEIMLKPLMKPLFRLPGVAALGAVLTFLSDNPAIISLAQENEFRRYFKKFQLISLTNFGTAFGMGSLVLIFMVGQGYFWQPLIGFFGAFVGCIVSTRLMQRSVIKAFPEYEHEEAAAMAAEQEASSASEKHIASETEKRGAEASGNMVALEEEHEKKGKGVKNSTFLRILNSMLDGGKSGVDVGIAIIPGVLIISTLVMILTFGPSPDGTYTGAAYEGIELLPKAAAKVSIIFEYLFGFGDPHLVAFPITALGAVGAALGLVPNFAAQGWIDGNAIAVFTAIGMCWSGYLSTHTAMLDSLGFRNLTSKAIGAHTIGGLVAALVAHWTFVLVTLIAA